MGNITHTRKARKATFNINVVEGNRVFTPVNQRAKTFATVLGKETLATADLRAIRKAGFRTYGYNAEGKLRYIAL